MKVHYVIFNGRTWFLTFRSVIAAFIVAIVCPAVVQAHDTPQDKYNMDVVCEARGQIGLPIPNETPDKLKILTQLFDKRLQQSGPAAGKTTKQIASDLAYWRSHLLQIAHSPSKSGQPKMLEPGNLGQFCTALPVIETVRRLRGDGS